MKSKYSAEQKWIMHELRRIHSKWPPRKKVYVDARVSRGQYKCAHCGHIFRPKEIDVDHIKPAISVDRGFVDWNEYIERLFPDESGYQVLCKECHKIKTHKEENPFRN